VAVISTFVSKGTALYLLVGFGACAFLSISLVRLDVALMLLLVSFNNPITTHLNPDYSRPSAYYPAVLLLAVTCIAVGMTLAIRKKLQRITTPLDVPIYAFSVLLFGSAFHGMLRNNEILYIIGDLFQALEFCIFFVLTTIAIRNKKQIELLLWGILISSIATSLLEIMMIFTGSARRVRIDSAVIPRIGNCIGFFLALEFPVLVCLYMYLGNKKHKLPLATLISLFGLTLILTFTRTLWIGAFTALLFVTFVIRSGLGKMKIILALISIVVILFIVTLPVQYLSKFASKSLYELVMGRLAFTLTQIFSPQSPVQVTRLNELIGVFKAITRSPIIGLGLGATYWGPTGKVESIFLQKHFIHNSYAQIALRMGLLGLSAYFWIAFIFIKRGLFVYKSIHNRASKGLVLGLVASFVGMAVAAITTQPLLRHPITPYLGTAMALVFILRKIDVEREKAKA
jgi:O-antigen ligase